MTPEIKQTLLRALDHLRDDLERAKAHFRNCTPEQMQQVWSGNGETRQEVLDGYQQERDRVIAATAWVEANG